LRYHYLLTSSTDTVILGGNNYYGTCTYDNTITFHYTDTSLPNPQTYQVGNPQTYDPNGQLFQLSFDCVNATFKLNNFQGSTDYQVSRPIHEHDNAYEFIRISVTSLTPQNNNSYVFNNVNFESGGGGSAVSGGGGGGAGPATWTPMPESGTPEPTSPNSFLLKYLRGCQCTICSFIN
jgi:hypothetical protein